MSSTCSSMDRASVFGTEGWGFESLRVHSLFSVYRFDVTHLAAVGSARISRARLGVTATAPRSKSGNRGSSSVQIDANWTSSMRAVRHQFGHLFDRLGTTVGTFDARKTEGHRPIGRQAVQTGRSGLCGLLRGNVGISFGKPLGSFAVTTSPESVLDSTRRHNTERTFRTLVTCSPPQWPR